VGIPVSSQAQHCIREASACQLLVHLDTTVLAKGVRELEGIQLDVGISMGESLDYRGHDIFGAVLLRANFVANIL
jgi:hypothetical protein